MSPPAYSDKRQTGAFLLDLLYYRQEKLKRKSIAENRSKKERTGIVVTGLETVYKGGGKQPPVSSQRCNLVGNTL